MKNILFSFLLLALVLYGCGAKSGLPENAIVFEVNEYENYESLAWQGKEYLPFMQIVEPSDVGECLGYYETAGKIIYVCELKGQSNEEWIVTTTNLDNRNEAMAFREKNTSVIPEGLESDPDYYWNN